MSAGAAPTMERTDAAWLAGLLDGEGCFDAPRGNPRIRVKMGDLDVVLRAGQLMGATLHEERDNRPTVDGRPRTPMAVAQVNGEAAVGIMLEVLPWLGSRRSGKVTEIVRDYRFKKGGRLALVKAAA